MNQFYSKVVLINRVENYFPTKMKQQRNLLTIEGQREYDIA